jgi:hypothetical protein
MIKIGNIKKEYQDLEMNEVCEVGAGLFKFTNINKVVQDKKGNITKLFFDGYLYLGDFLKIKAILNLVPYSKISYALGALDVPWSDWNMKLDNNDITIDNDLTVESLDIIFDGVNDDDLLEIKEMIKNYLER